MLKNLIIYYLIIVAQSRFSVLPMSAARGSCVGGDCVALCESHSLTSCACDGNASDYCRWCCMGGEGGTCRPFTPPGRLQPLLLPPGTTCKLGYCDERVSAPTPAPVDHHTPPSIVRVANTRGGGSIGCDKMENFTLSTGYSKINDCRVKN